MISSAQIGRRCDELRTADAFEAFGREFGDDDPALLGRLVVKIGSQMIDSAIRTRLNTLAHAMKG